DLPGSGESASPATGGDADALPEPMESALQALLGEAPVDLVGFSFGTMVATLLAAQWPQRVRRLVLSGAPAVGINPDWKPTLRSDLPGSGESASPATGGDADALPEPMESALQALLGEAPVDLVGFSFGTMVATLLAAQWPQRVRRLVLSGAPALGINPDWKPTL